MMSSFLSKIKRLLEKYMHERGVVCSLSLFMSGKEFLEQCENRVKFDIVFLDINMDKMDGIQTAMQIRSFHNDTYIVFVTAYIDYALGGGGTCIQTISSMWRAESTNWFSITWSHARRNIGFMNRKEQGRYAS